MDNERRAPVLARHEMPADPRLLRDVLRRVEADLRDVDHTTRHEVVLLVGAVANRWTRQRWSREGHSMIIDVERLPSRVRVEVFSHAALPREFWEQVGIAVAPGHVDRWGVERRHRSGLWFEFPAVTAAADARHRAPAARAPGDA
jgi:hypothetical protein